MRYLMTALALASLPGIAQAGTTPAQLDMTLRGDAPGPVIAPEIYGQFAEHLGSCIYGGIWVGPDSRIPNTRGIRNDVVQALKELHVPVLRWPGGCFADDYHWRDGIGPRNERPAMINNWWGGVVENNAFGTNEFFDLCEMIGCKTYVTGNVGSGTVREMKEWVEYMTSDADSPMANLRRKNGRDKPFKLDYFGIGNEAWGCGGNMRPEYYSDLFRRYDTYIKDYDPKHHVYRIASGANGGNLNWTETLMDRIGKQMDGVSVHYYTIPSGEWKVKGPSTGFDKDAYAATIANTLKMDDILSNHSAIMDRTDPKKHIGLIVDEWGIWTDVVPGTNPAFLYQQNSLRDAILAALNFNIFHRHADRVHMANIAQMINVLQAMILTDGPKMVRTPSYYAFQMYAVHQGATFLPVEGYAGSFELGGKTLPRVSATASRAEDGTVHVSLVNVDPDNPATVDLALEGVDATAATGAILTAPAVDSINTFDAPDTVSPKSFDGARVANGKLTATLPAKSIVTLTLK